MSPRSAVHRRRGTAPRVAVVAATLAALLATGCSTIAEQATEAALEAAAGASGADVDIEDGGERITIEGEGGSMTVGVGELPDAVRDAFTLPADLEVTSGTTMTEGGNTLAGITGFVPRTDASALAAQLTAAITAAGWELSMDYTAGEGVRVLAAERAGETLNVGMTPAASGEGYDLSITVTKNAG
jgi:hypothetical protein